MVDEKNIRRVFVRAATQAAFKAIEEQANNGGGCVGDMEDERGVYIDAFVDLPAVMRTALAASLELVAERVEVMATLAENDAARSAFKYAAHLVRMED